MTALTEQRILGIRNGDQVLVPPMEWDPATGAELAARLRRGRPGRHRRVVDVGADAVRAAPARPRRSRSRSSASTARPRRCCTRSTPARPTRCRRHAASRRAGGARAHRPHRRHRVLRARRGARGRGRRRRPADRAGDDDGLPRVDHLPQPGPADARPDRRGQRARTGSSASECPTCGRVYAGGRGYCPIDAIELQRGARGRPAADRHDHQLHDHHAGAVPGPDRDRAVRPGVRAARRHRRRPRLPAGRSSCPPPTSASACASSAVWASPGEDGRRRRPMGGAYGRLIGWIPTGEPDVDDPDLVNRIF